MRAYRKLFQYVAEIRREVFIKTSLLLIVSAASIVQAILMSHAVNRVFAGEGLKQIVWLLTGVILAIAARCILLRFNETYTKTMATTIKGKLRYSIVRKVFQLGPGQMSARRSGKVTSLILDGIESLEPFFVQYVPQILTVIASGLFVFFYLGAYDRLSSWILLASMALCVLLPLITVPVMNRTVTDYWTRYSQMTSQYIDAVQGIDTLKTLDAEGSMGEILKEDATAFWHQSIRNTGISLANSGVMLLLTSATSSLTVVIVALRAHAGLVAPAAISAFLFLAVECARPMMELNRAWHSSFLGISVAKDLFDVLDMEVPIRNGDAPVSADFHDSLPTIQFEQVDFAYPGRDRVLHNVDFSIPGGQTAAIVGHSGAGKSTVLNLLLRFYDPDGGTIRINETDLRQFDLRSLQSQIAVVFQDTFLFYGTILDNIRMASPEASEEEVIEAAKAANAHEFITRLPEGYQTLVGERGMTLSGGERQRIAIARAVLKKAPILLLDEATSSVDASSEALIQQAISRLSQSCTTLIVAHRLSTVRSADQILVMEEGEIVERGTHEQLLEQKGVYAQLIRAQKEATA